MAKKRILSLLLCAGLICTSALCGCTVQAKYENTSSAAASDSASTASTEESGSAPSQETVEGALAMPEDGGFKTVDYKLTEQSDKYRTFYEIFPYSFCDSNGDGIGDFNGITSKLDYLNDGDTKTTDDLGIEGIWLMPIMQSDSYHKYDVIDYKSVDSSYGTIEDFEKLVSECHKRGINVIIDFVINHSSTSCEWFKKAIEELKAGKTDGYVQYYNFTQEDKKNVKGWSSAGVEGWYYECEFWDQMPDLNLKNENLRKELLDAAKFWLDKGVDGFRLDAVLWFEKTYEKGANDEASVDELKWFYESVKKEKDDVYMVGECWEDPSVISKYYASGIDSLFDFKSEGFNGRVATAVNKEDAKTYVESIASWQKQITEVNKNAINTPFISNHDTARSAGFFTDDYSRKLAAALYILSPGNAFIYYGEEIAMEGGEKDENKRKGMYWSATDKTGFVEKIPGMSDDSLPEKAVDELEKDENSLLNFYKRVIALKNQNPEIKKGTATPVSFGDDYKECAGYVMDSDGSKVFVLFNTAGYATKVTVPESDFKISEVRGYAIAGAEKKSESSDPMDDLFGTPEPSKDSNKPDIEADNFIVKDQEVTLPARSVIVLK